MKVTIQPENNIMSRYTNLSMARTVGLTANGHLGSNVDQREYRQQMYRLQAKDLLELPSSISIRVTWRIPDSRKTS